jgi:hypothetical protein
MTEQAITLHPETVSAAASKTEAAYVLTFIGIFGFVVFLFWGTGFATDDYVFLLQGLTQPIAQNWWPKTYISIPVLHYTNALPYFVIGNRPWAFDLLKAIYAGVGVYFASRFFSSFCLPRRAQVFGFLFVFLPLYDAVVYSFTDLYLVISFTCYLYAYYLGDRNRLSGSVIFAAIGSLSSYGSPPIALGLAALAFARGQRKVAAALFLPNVAYVAYYLFTSQILRIGTQRLTGQFGIIPLAKQFALQVVSFLDAAVGPSAWAKIIYSIASLDALGWLVALLAAVATIYYVATERRSTADRRLLGAAAIILIGALGMFALTGLYPQMSFSLGDRVMIYGGFFLICLLAALPMNGPVESAIVVVLMLAIVGISDHWKQWQGEVAQVGANIRGNEAIRALPPGTLLYVSRHQYSHLGPYAHIDFFTASYVVQTFFKLQLGNDTPLRFASFNRRLVLANGDLRDRKYGDVAPVNGGIWLYDSQRNTLDYVAAANLQKRIDALPDDIRHWTQQLKNNQINALISWIAPSLRYAYSSSGRSNAGAGDVNGNLPPSGGSN